MSKESGITVKKEGDFSEWYTQVIQKAELVEYTDVSGCYVLRPNAFEIWNKIKEEFTKKIKNVGVKEAYFPLLIPEGLLKKEKEHVEGFNPEVAWVTHAGDTKLNDKLAIRPTSETIMYDAYSKWIRSYKDLPLKINQWVNIIRWEFKHSVPFLRSREFLWQEGHNVFATEKEIEKDTLEHLEFYKGVFEGLLAIPVLSGRKTDKEKFAGADATYSVETFLPNGKAIQGATSHNLGQNFSKVFNIKFLDKDEKTKYVWQNSWGLSTRTIGILIMIHGDDKGLVLPPKLASVKAVIIPILFEKSKKNVLEKAKEINKLIEDSYLDDREEYSPGWKFNEYELKGIPLRIEVGPKDVENNQVVVVRRDNGEKINVKMSQLKKKIEDVLDEIQKNLFKKAKKFMDENTVEVKNYEEFKKYAKENKLILANWCGDVKCEDAIKDECSGVKSLVIPFKQNVMGNCVKCNKKAKFNLYFAKSY